MMLLKNQQGSGEPSKLSCFFCGKTGQKQSSGIPVCDTGRNQMVPEILCRRDVLMWPETTFPEGYAIIFSARSYAVIKEVGA